MHEVKVVLVGDSSVGKSSLFSNIINNFSENAMQPTVGSAYGKYRLFLGKHGQTTVHLWDTAGQERFRSLITMYMRDADLVIFMYDCNNHDSLDNISRYWVKELIKLDSGEEFKSKWLLVGNKVDLLREVSYFEEENTKLVDMLTHDQSLCVYGKQMNPRFSAHVQISCTKKYNINNVRKLLVYLIEKHLDEKPVKYIEVMPPKNDTSEGAKPKCTNCTIL